MAEEQVRLIWNCRLPTSDTRRQLVENVLASWLLYARWIADTQLSPSAVWFEHPLPAGTRLEQYEAFLLARCCSNRAARPCWHR